MKSDAIAYGVAGIVFGLIAGWIIGAQQANFRAAGTQASAPASASTAPASGGDQTTRAAVVDQTQVNALTSVAERDPKNPKPRVDLGNLYFDAERYDDAIKWYSEAIKLSPNDVNV